MHQKLQESISQRLQHPEQQTTNNVEEQWTRIKEATYDAASKTLGFATSKHKDWFDDQETEAEGLLDVMHSTHLAWMRDKNCSVKKMAYTQARQKAQLRLREMKNRWRNNEAAKLQAAADRHDTRTFFYGLKAVLAKLVLHMSNRSTVSLSLTARRSLNVGRSTSRLSLTNRLALICMFYQRSRNGHWLLVWIKYQQELRSKKP